jgi:hypothetical protein
MSANLWLAFYLLMTALFAYQVFDEFSPRTIYRLIASVMSVIGMVATSIIVLEASCVPQTEVDPTLRHLYLVKSTIAQISPPVAHNDAKQGAS